MYDDTKRDPIAEAMQKKAWLLNQLLTHYETEPFTVPKESYEMVKRDQPASRKELFGLLFDIPRIGDVSLSNNYALLKGGAINTELRNFEKFNKKISDTLKNDELSAAIDASDTQTLETLIQTSYPEAFKRYKEFCEKPVISESPAIMRHREIDRRLDDDAIQGMNAKETAVGIAKNLNLTQEQLANFKELLIKEQSEEREK